IGAVAVLGPDHDVGRVLSRRGELRQGGRGHPPPPDVGDREPGHTVEVGDHVDTRQLPEPGPVPPVPLRVRRGAVDLQVPAVRAEPRHRAVVHRGPSARHILPWWQPSLRQSFSSPDARSKAIFPGSRLRPDSASLATAPPPCAIVTAMQRNFWRFYGYRPTGSVARRALR